MQRLHSEGVAAADGAFLTDKLFVHDFAAMSRDVDVKPTPAALASLAEQTQSQSLSSLHKDQEFMFSRRQMWRYMHPIGSYSAGKDFTQMSLPPSARQTGTEMVGQLNQRCIEDMAATAAADVIARRFDADQEHSSQRSYFPRQQTYQPTADAWQYPSAQPVPSYNFMPQPPCESSGPVSASFPSGFAQDVCSEFPRKPPPGETGEMPERCHYLQPSNGSGLHSPYSASNVTTSPYQTGVSHEQGMHMYPHHRHRRHHTQYSHYHHQQYRSAQLQSQLPSSLPLCPKVKQVQADEQLTTYSSDSTSPEFISEADIAAQRLPGALKLINDLQRRDSRLRESVDQLRCYADELLERLKNCMMGNGEDGTSLELDSSGLTRQMIVMACQLCDQALFVLVEWARHAHFFRQLPVSSLLLQSICHMLSC